MALLPLVGLIALSPPDDYAAIYKDICRDIESSYYARRERRKEMTSYLEEAAPKATAAKSHEEFRDIVNAMIARFGDSHFLYAIEGDQAFYLNSSFGRGTPKTMANIGAWFRRTPEGYTVQMVLEGSAAEAAGLHKGDLIVSVDNKPFAPVFSFEADAGKTARLSFRENGKDFERDVPVSQDTALDMFFDASERSIKVMDMPHGRKFGYIHPWTLINDTFRRVVRQAVTGKLAKTDGIILDLRDGFGGRPEGFEGPFIDYPNAVVVLINGGSRSAREVLSYNLRKSGHATLIGQRTAGNVLGTFPMQINDWSNLEIPMMNIKVDGVRLEGVGVLPDIPVEKEFDDQYNDLDLAEGIHYLMMHTKSHTDGNVMPQAIAGG